MYSSDYNKAINIYIPKIDNNLEILSLLLNAFDNSINSAVRQKIQVQNSFNDNSTCSLKNSYQSNVENIPKIGSYSESNFKKTWDNTSCSYIQSLVENNMDIDCFIKALNLMLNFCPDGMTVGIEYQYVDRIYRDSYYIHLGGEHCNKSRFCKRLVFFRGDHCDNIKDVSVNNIKHLQDNFIGSMVIRPIKEKSIGRSLLNPYYFRTDPQIISYVRVAEYNISYCGIKLHVKAFPFEMQDGITTTCAEITLLNLLDYYSNEFQDYKFAVPSTLKQIIKKTSADRVTPATGISYEDISRVLYQTGFAPKFYHESHNMNSSEIIQIISFYIESGIPVAIGMNQNENKKKRGHSVICIGYENISHDQISDFVKSTSQHNIEIEKIVNSDYEDECKNTSQDLSIIKQTMIWKKVKNSEIKILHRVYSYAAIKQFVIQDDLNQPYHTMVPNIKQGTLSDSNNEWYINCIVAPLYKRMYMDARQAQKVIDQILISSLGPSPKGSDNDNYIVVRLFLASSRNLQEHRIMTIQNPQVRSLYRSTPFPQFVWCAELYDIAQFPDNDAFGEIILDATNAEGVGLDSIIMINYGSKHLSRDRNGNNITNSSNIQNPSESPGSFDLSIFNTQEAGDCTYKPYNHNLQKFS